MEQRQRIGETTAAFRYRRQKARQREAAAFLVRYWGLETMQRERGDFSNTPLEPWEEWDVDRWEEDDCEEPSGKDIVKELLAAYSGDDGGAVADGGDAAG